VHFYYLANKKKLQQNNYLRISFNEIDNVGVLFDHKPLAAIFVPSRLLKNVGSDFTKDDSHHFENCQR
jgi:hypothetical protein